MTLQWIGALITAITLAIVLYSKFLEGAWIIVLLLPLLVIVFWRINRHYQQVRKQLSLKGLPPSLKPFPPPRVVIPISGVHRGVIDAVDFAQAISKNVSVVYIELEPGMGEKVREAVGALVARYPPGGQSHRPTGRSWDL